MGPRTADMKIRKATTQDLDHIIEVVSLAFNAEQYVLGEEVVEATLVRELLSDNDDIVNLVAVDAEIIGHVFVSPVSLEPGKRSSCGQVSPLSVHPDRQTAGVGSALMHAAIEESKAAGLDVLFLLGDPNYYQRFGFVASQVDNVYGISKHFQELELNAGCVPDEKTYVHLAPAFARLGI
ncbi:MAG: N-acetyltransferase [Gammaproteobacteria bacterium]|nr:MAG: N-acetyltransferase [Gammaproteobacteria bacterium]